MMKTDSFDKLLWLLLGVMLVTLLILLSQGAHRDGGMPAGGVANRAMERELTYQARVALVQKLYGPVEEFRRKGELQTALLKLDELARQYPGEAHGYIIQGEILQQMGLLDSAMTSYVAGVKLDGVYLDKKSPLSRRDLIDQLITEADRGIGARARANPSNRTLATALGNINYLKSRLAGGCE